MLAEGCKCNKSVINVFKILIAVALLLSCSSASQRAPVQDRPSLKASKLGYHVVSKGETLYSIAWRYGIDYKLLARRNGISGRYTIYPGQKIQLYKAAANLPKAAPKSTVKSTPTKRSKTTTTRVVKTSPLPKNSGKWKWQWPAKGKVLAGFSSQKNLNKGVDIDGRLGESVVAAAPGVVVYAGSGIRGYGNLLIIKHDEKFLSAYAHNSRLLVKEKGVVKGGQKIAEIGNSGTNQSKLHFEIRREGKPVDPLRYLPKR
jgi:lipoprotein NlpD